MPTVPVAGQTGDEITIPATLPANRLKVGYYQVIIADLGSMLPGEFYFYVTGQTTHVTTTTVPAARKDDVWYDLQGRAFTDKPVRHGIYITNGKKRLIE